MATFNINQELNGIEISFDAKPEAATLDALKANGYRWHRSRRIWYAKQTAERLELAKAITNGEQVSAPTTAKKPSAKVNKYGVKVGDFFVMQWGYEQTNNSFFQVIALVGTSSVRVREVSPEIIDRDAVSGMSENHIYNLDTSVILPPQSSVFIKDNENGDLKRIKSYASDGVSNPQINIASYADAHHTTKNALEVYESWYY